MVWAVVHLRFTGGLCRKCLAGSLGRTAMYPNHTEDTPWGSLWGPLVMGYVGVPAFHIATSQEAAAAGEPSILPISCKNLPFSVDSLKTVV